MTHDLSAAETLAREARTLHLATIPGTLESDDEMLNIAGMEWPVVKGE